MSAWRGLILLIAVVFGVTGCGETRAFVGIHGPQAEFVAEPARPSDVTPPEEPFLYLPFRAEDARDLKITSDWKTAQDEMPIALDEEHMALDFEGVKYGRPVVAMADGEVVATFQSGVARGAANQEAPYNTLWTDPITGRQGYLGYAGLIVDVIFDKTDGAGVPYRAQYFHLGGFPLNADGALAIAYHEPTRKPDVTTIDGKMAKVYVPEGLNDPTVKRTRVKAGDIIGYIGDSGINFGYDDVIDPVTGVIAPRDRAASPPWDPQGAGAVVPLEDAAQLHLEVFTRGPDGAKRRLDPLDLYAQTIGTPGQAGYQNHANPEPGVFCLGPKTAFRHDDGRLLFAA